MGRFLLCLLAGLAGVTLQACIVQVSPPPGLGGPRQWGDRLTRGVGGRFYARALTWGIALVRSPVRRAARGRLPLARSGNLPQGGVVALEVRLSWHVRGLSSAWTRCGSGWTRGISGAGTAPGSSLQESMKASKESSSQLCPLGDVPPSSARWGVSRVVSRASDPALVSGGSRGSVSARAARCARGAAPA